MYVYLGCYMDRFENINAAEQRFENLIITAIGKTAIDGVIGGKAAMDVMRPEALNAYLKYMSYFDKQAASRYEHSLIHQDIGGVEQGQKSALLELCKLLVVEEYLISSRLVPDSILRRRLGRMDVKWYHSQPMEIVGWSLDERLKDPKIVQTMRNGGKAEDAMTADELTVYERKKRLIDALAEEFLREDTNALLGEKEKKVYMELAKFAAIKSFPPLDAPYNIVTIGSIIGEGTVRAIERGRSALDVMDAAKRAYYFKHRELVEALIEDDMLELVKEGVELTDLEKVHNLEMYRVLHVIGLIEQGGMP